MSNRAVRAAKRAVVLVIAIATICILRFGFPSAWNNIIAALFGEPLNHGEGELAVYFIDVGQGDCVYISFPDGNDMLIDGGSTKSGGLGASEGVLAYLDTLVTDGKLNHLMLTHTDADHVRYLDDVLERYSVENVYMPALRPSDEKMSAYPSVNAKKLAMFTDKDYVDTTDYANFFVAALNEPNCAVHLNMDDSERTNNIVIKDEGNTYTFTFYCPTADYYADTDNTRDALNLNAVSPVGILEYNSIRFVFTGDSNEMNEPSVTERIGFKDCDVLKVAHHGSTTSSSEEFLRAVNCEYAVISSGAGNSYGHPTAELLERLTARGMEIYRTDELGTVLATVSAEGKLTFKSSKEF